MGAAELDAWLAYYGEEPWGASRDNAHAAMICAIIVNAANALSGNRSAKRVSSKDFMIVGAQEREERQRRGMSALINALRTIGKKRRKK